MKKQDELTFEEAFAGLEKAAEKMEQEDITLEEALKYYEDSVKYLEICKSILKEAEGRIMTLKENGDAG